MISFAGGLRAFVNGASDESLITASAHLLMIVVISGCLASRRADPNVNLVTASMLVACIAFAASQAYFQSAEHSDDFFQKACAQSPRGECPLRGVTKDTNE